MTYTTDFYFYEKKSTFVSEKLNIFYSHLPSMELRETEKF